MACLRQHELALLVDFAAACTRSLALLAFQRTSLASVTALVACDVHPLLSWGF